jgi:hypothetical protein
MTTQKFAMRIEVPAKLVGTIIELLDGEGTIVSVEQMREKAPSSGRGSGHHYAGGKKNKGISGEVLAIEILATAGRSGVAYKKAEAMFADRGFAKTSASPNLSKAVKAGRARVVDNVFYFVK